MLRCLKNSEIKGRKYLDVLTKNKLKSLDIKGKNPVFMISISYNFNL